MHLVTQEGGGYAWIPSIMRFVDGQIVIETATHSYRNDWKVGKENALFIWFQFIAFVARK